MKVRTNAIINQFKPVSWKSKVTLFNSQGLSLYGCNLWRLDDKKVENICTTWKVCCRRLLGLSPRTRSHLIPQLMETAPILDIIMYRALKDQARFYRKIAQFKKYPPKSIILI